ncbi:MAG: cation diffusion facilitator CzcD-associated flavoprotein CzcO/acetyl esterase/lipase [Candidatus Poriferisodalaceae bacterium]|jgi:cation diffusion facilitator CzcD-associated flavoprotein CzcO/acetyl esterase/lipase
MAIGSDTNATDSGTDVDVVVVGAGMAGLYLLHRLRKAGFSAQAFETGDDVGGTWYWNRYPGARCDVQSIDYSYSFDPELATEWTWSEKYATQPEILRYLQHVAEKHDLRRDIQFSTKVEAAKWDDDASLWRLTTSQGDDVSCRHYVMATGCLSLPKAPEITGADTFAGDVYFTSSWPHDGVDFTGKRVGVIGTGSSGIQSIPLIAEQAAELTVFQRTPNFSVPAFNGPIPADKLAMIEGRHAEYRQEAKLSRGGVPGQVTEVGAMMVSEEERQTAYEAAWEVGELAAILGPFSDLLVNPASNETMAEFIRNKIRSIVDDPATAELLCPTNHPFGTKRPCLDSGYYATYNLAHVSLVDLHSTPITNITESGINTTGASHEFDVIVYATGFDAMTGAIVSVDITGRDGLSLADKWADGPLTYLGLTVRGFPNFFTITGPGSPSVLSNMVVSIEQHVDWITDCLIDLRSRGVTTIEPTETAEAGWLLHNNDCANITLYPQANSWYMGANVPGKPRVFLPYVGGVGGYRQACDEVAEDDYLGFELGGQGGVSCNDGIIRRLQPDLAMVLEMMAGMELPPIESMTPEEARAFSEAGASARPPGPEVGEIVDGTFPGADGDLDYRIYRPAGDGPFPVVVYYHGGGWVLGSAASDDPLCRDLCDRTGALVISLDYRHGHIARFPAAVDDAVAGLQWVASNIATLGGDPDRMVVAGWSAGANQAAVVAQWARDYDGPSLKGQLLLTPVTDAAARSGSYEENAEGYILTASLMDWFFDHYVDDADRADPRISPLRAESLAGLPPALVVTAEFDPLRDEGAAYADALSAAGGEVRHLAARGHNHTSIQAVGMVISGAPIRAEMAEALIAMLA